MESSTNFHVSTSAWKFPWKEANLIPPTSKETSVEVGGHFHGRRSKKGNNMAGPKQQSRLTTRCKTPPHENGDSGSTDSI